MMTTVQRNQLLADRQIMLVAQAELVSSLTALEKHMECCSDEQHWMERALGLHALARIDQVLTEIEERLGLEVD